MGRIAPAPESVATPMTRAASEPLVAPPPANAWEKAAVALVLVAAAWLRLRGITTWLLANVDEVSALNQIDLPTTQVA